MDHMTLLGGLVKTKFSDIIHHEIPLTISSKVFLHLTPPLFTGLETMQSILLTSTSLPFTIYDFIH